MRRPYTRLLLAGAALVLTAGCATSEEWAIWRQNSAHFASLEHLKFSNRNREGEAPRVTRADIQLARQQNWWGRPITVAQEQILER
ncbi:MAG: hypothetical protein AAB418_05775 [candidate division NC10 bacterium]|jgi:hypothetical protein